MAYESAVASRLFKRGTSQILTLGLVFLTCMPVAIADQPNAESTNSPMENGAGPFVTVEYVQPADESNDNQSEDSGLSALSELEDLLSEPVLVRGQAPATLTAVEDTGTAETTSQEISVPRKTPAAVTRIDAKTSWSSVARSLNESFDIYVPNVQVIRHHFGLPHVGIRGIDAHEKTFSVQGSGTSNFNFASICFQPRSCSRKIEV